jgi:hypothetical protein
VDKALFNFPIATITSVRILLAYTWQSTALAGDIERARYRLNSQHVLQFLHSQQLNVPLHTLYRLTADLLGTAVLSLFSALCLSLLVKYSGLMSGTSKDTDFPAKRNICDKAAMKVTT